MYSIPRQFCVGEAEAVASPSMDEIFSAIMAAETSSSPELKFSTTAATTRSPQILRPAALQIANGGDSAEGGLRYNFPFDNNGTQSRIRFAASAATADIAAGDDDKCMSPPAKFAAGIAQIKLEPPGNSPPDTFSTRISDDLSDCETSHAKKCTVCGDTARGHHYDVISCNGCKTFFRRTVIAGRRFRCLKDGKCDLTKDRRCACRACRFEKCVAVGMNPKAIQFQSSQSASTSSMPVVRKRSLSNHQSDEDDDKSLVAHRLDSVISPTGDFRTAKTIEYLLLIEEMCDRLRRSQFVPESENLMTADILKLPPIFIEVDRYPEMKSWPERPASLALVRKIPLEERKNIGLKVWYYLDSFLTVEYAKTLPGIDDLTFDDKLALCRSSCLSTMCLTQAFCAVQQQSSMICFPDGFRPLKRVKDPKAIHFEINCKLPDMFRRLEMDRVQHALLKAILFLNAAAAGLSDDGRRVIESLRSQRADELLQYLRSTLGSARGAVQFASLIGAVDVCHRLCAKQQAMFVKSTFVDRIVQPPPLMVELIAQVGHSVPVESPVELSSRAFQWS